MAEKALKKTNDADAAIGKNPGYDLFTFNTEGNTISVTQHGDDALQRIYGSEARR